MMSEKISPVRMCIICRSRLPQKSLNRFQVKEGVLRAFDKYGRSFYICETCLNGNQQKLIKTINQKYNLNLPYKNGENLKENRANG
jgi:predicted RNA-binding protein YlxR (DUF448 family)